MGRYDRRELVRQSRPERRFFGLNLSVARSRSVMAANYCRPPGGWAAVSARVPGEAIRAAHNRPAARWRRLAQRACRPAARRGAQTDPRAPRDAVDHGATRRTGGTVQICLRGAVHQARRPGAPAVPDLLADAARTAAAASQQRRHRPDRRASGLPDRASIQPSVQAPGRHRTRRLPPRQMASASPGSNQDPSAARIPISPDAGHHAMEEPHDP
jgi:hypothetical protein